MATTQRTARDLVAEIATAAAEGDHENAARAAGWGVEAFPDAAAFHRLRGVSLAALGANDEAKADLQATLAVDPLDHEALVALSRIEEAEGDLYTAAEHLLTAWEHDPANGLLRSDLTYRLARLYGSEGYLQYTRPALAALYVRNAYPERAAREYAAALAEQPNRVDLRLASALARWRLGALAEAADGCVVLLGEHPQLVRARWALADALARRGQGDEAREHARHAAQLDPDGAIARAMIESNPDTTVVDPDETVRVPLDAVRSPLRAIPTAPPFGTVPLTVAASPAPAVFADAPPAAMEDDASTGAEPDDAPPIAASPETTAGTLEDSVVADDTYAEYDTHDDAPTEAAPAVLPDDNASETAAPDPEFTARANAELDSFEETLASLERTLAALNASRPREVDAAPAEEARPAPLVTGMSDVSEMWDAPRELPPGVGEGVRGATAMPPSAPENAFATPSPPSSPAQYDAWDDERSAEDTFAPPAMVPEPPAFVSAATYGEDAPSPAPAPADVPPQPDEEPEPVIATVTEGGDVLTTRPGEEPLLEDADALPAASDRAELPAALLPDVGQPRSGAIVMPETPPAAPQFAQPAPSSVVPVHATPPASPLASTASELPAMIRERVAAGDAAGAVGVGRAALTAAGKDLTQVRGLLPALRVLVEAVPDRPDARRLLGDAYRRLGQMSQAQGQYQQALLVRVAGKK